VSPKILTGADLMLQGLHPEVPPGEWEEGDARCVVAKGNPFPFGVGSMLVSSSAAQAGGLKGRGLKLLHHFPDSLWAMGDKSLPDVTFTPERVYQLGQAPEAAVAAAAEAAAAAAAAAAKLSAMQLEAAAAAAAAAAPPPPAAAEAGAPTAESAATPEGMDAMLDWCLLRGLADKVGDGELPVKCEELYSKVLLPSRPPGTTADIKKSGYKKLTKLFSVWEKKGLLTVKAVHKIDNVVAVNRAHPALLASAAALAAASAAAAPAAEAAGGGGAAAASASDAAISVEAVYRSPSSLRPVFGDLLKDAKERLLTEAECGSALRAYAQQAGLLEGESCKLDELLAGHLYGKKEVETVGSVVELPRLLPRLTAKLNAFTRLRITRAGGATEEVVQKGGVKNIRVTAEDRHAGRKHVTRVTGLEYFAIEPDELGGRVQKLYNTSCSVAPLPGKNETQQEVAAQGKLLAEVAELLRRHYGAPPRPAVRRAQTHPSQASRRSTWRWWISASRVPAMRTLLTPAAPPGWGALAAPSPPPAAPGAPSRRAPRPSCTRRRGAGSPAGARAATPPRARTPARRRRAAWRPAVAAERLGAARRRQRRTGRGAPRAAPQAGRLLRLRQAAQAGGPVAGGGGAPRGGWRRARAGDARRCAAGPTHPFGRLRTAPRRGAQSQAAAHPARARRGARRRGGA